MDNAARGRSLHGYSVSEVTNFINCGLRNDLLAIVGLVPLSFGHSADKTESFSFGYSDGSGNLVLIVIAYLACQ